MGIIEQWGTGIAKIFAKCAKMLERYESDAFATNAWLGHKIFNHFEAAGNIW